MDTPGTVSVAGGMGLRDRFYSPQTAKALLSWRIAVAIAVAAVLAVLDLPVYLAVVVGLGTYVALVAAAMPRSPGRPAIDPFVLSEPWRQLVQAAQGAERKLRDTVATVQAGPLRAQLESILDQLRGGLDQAWAVARRGDEIDAAVRRLDPVELRAKQAVLQQRCADDPSSDASAALASVGEQLATADRLQHQSGEIADTLRLTQTQLDSLVARASEVTVGTVETATYAREVDDLVIKLEALRLAVNETRP
jgi:hypothetical protein